MCTNKVKIYKRREKRTPTRSRNTKIFHIYTLYKYKHLNEHPSPTVHSSCCLRTRIANNSATTPTKTPGSARIILAKVKEQNDVVAHVTR